MEKDKQTEFTSGPGRGSDQWTRGGQQKPEVLWCWSHPCGTVTQRAGLEWLIQKERTARGHCETVLQAPFSKVISYSSLVEALSFVEELGDVFWSVSEQLILHQKHDALQRVWKDRHRKTNRKLRLTTHVTSKKCTFFGSMLNFFLPIATCRLFCRVLLMEAKMYNQSPSHCLINNVNSSYLQI